MPKKRKPNGKTEIKPFPKEVQEMLKEHEWWLEAEKELAATEEGCREELDGNATPCDTEEPER